MLFNNWNRDNQINRFHDFQKFIIVGDNLIPDFPIVEMMFSTPLEYTIARNEIGCFF